MTEKRFTLIECNGNIEDGCTQNVYDGGEDVFELLDLLNSLFDENEQLKKDLIDHSALISMLEDYQALKIGDTLWNLTDAKSEEEFNELYEPYLEKAKRCWR